MESIEKTIHINAPVEEVFEYIDDPRNDPEWMPDMVEVHDVEGPPGVGRQFRWTFKMVGVPLKGHSATIEHVPNRRTVTESKGGVSSTWFADVEPAGDGTKLTMKVEYAIPVPVLGKLAEHLVAKRNKQNFELSVDNIKQILEG